MIKGKGIMKLRLSHYTRLLDCVQHRGECPIKYEEYTNTVVTKD